MFLELFCICLDEREVSEGATVGQRREILVVENAEDTGDFGAIFYLIRHVFFAVSIDTHETTHFLSNDCKEASR